MTRDEVLHLLLEAADDLDRVFDYTDIAEWPEGTLGCFERIGILRAAPGGLHARCPNCLERHVEPVTVRGLGDGTTRLFISCPADLRVEVTPEMCAGWEIDPDGLAAATSKSIDLKGKPKAVSPGRLWRLGRMPWKKSTRAVVLAIRMADADAASLALHVGQRTVVLVPHLRPDERIWAKGVPALIALSQITTVCDDRLLIDVVAMVDLIEEADRLAESRSLLPTDPAVKRAVVRSQVKAEIKGHLDDDVLVAAYREFNSGDKAAAALTERLGRTISRDKVYRAVKRARAAGQFDEPGDSPSVSRTVASQPRNRSKKFVERR